MSIKLGLVTVLYNGKEVLEGFYNSLNIQKFKNFVLYIIDNSPNDDAINEAKILSKKYKIETKHIKNQENCGVAKGNNQGIDLAIKDGCDFILLLNNDIEFNENVIGDMVEYSIENSEDIIVPKIYFYNTNKLWFAGGRISGLFGRNFHDNYGQDDFGQSDEIKYITYSPTCFMLIKRNVFDIIGLMDEKYFVYYDDTDFVFRAVKSGIKIVYYPKAVVYHKVSFSTGGLHTPFSVYYLTRNRLYFIVKNYPVAYKIFSLSYFFINRIFFLIKYPFHLKKSLLKGLKDGLKMVMKNY